MVLMENGRMDSNLQLVDAHVITELGNKSVTSRLSDGNESSVTFENLDVISGDTFSNCNGISTSSEELPSSLINGISICSNHDENSYNSNSEGSNSSQCSINSVQKTINSSLENSLSNLSIRADLEEVSLTITEPICVNCDNSSPSNDSSAEFNQRSVNENEPKTDICCTSVTIVQDDPQSSHQSRKEEGDGNSSEIVYICYESEKQMPDIMKLIQKDLSEPYSIYTYRYFIHNWPHLCFLALCEGKSVGAIVCKLDIHRKVIKRGYIAMLAVDESYRKHGIGSNLVLKAIRVMAAEGADEVVLETEITNQPALHLYENLGFVRDKRLFRYYLNGVDALRLKLWLR